MIEDIVEKQKELVELALKFGLGSEITIKCSQELDQLIILYQKNGSYSSDSSKKDKKCKCTIR